MTHFRLCYTKSAQVKNVLPILAIGVLFFIGAPKTATGAFQETLWGARPTGLVGAFTALADDANAPAYNPAGVALVPDDEITIMYAQLYSGVNFFVGEDTSRLGLGYFSYIPDIKDKKYGSFAISWSNFVATNLLREDSFSLTYADSFQFEQFNSQPVLAYGANAKFLRRSFSTDSRTDTDPVFANGRDSDALTLDLGVIYRPHFTLLPGFSFGASAQNVTEPDIGLAATDKVPARYAFGVAYQDRKFRWLNPSVDLARRNGRTVVSAGWESYFARETLAFRLGGNEDQLGGGLGYQFKLFKGFIMKLDYAILWPLNVEGTNGSHRVSLTVNFDSFSSRKAKVKEIDFSKIKMKRLESEEQQAWPLYPIGNERVQ